MDENSLATRVLRALIPAHFPDLNAMHRASGIAYSTLQAWRRQRDGEDDGNEPRWDQVQKLAKLVGVQPFELVLGASTPSNAVTLRHHPDWQAAYEAARARPGRLPEAAFQLAGDTAAAQWPERIDRDTVLRLAEFWFHAATDRELVEAETATVRAEMRAEDDAGKVAPRAKTGAKKKAK